MDTNYIVVATMISLICGFLGIIQHRQINDTVNGFDPKNYKLGAEEYEPAVSAGRDVILLCDEMKLKCGIAWNTKTHKLSGFVDEALNVDNEASASELVDCSHCSPVQWAPKHGKESERRKAYKIVASSTPPVTTPTLGLPGTHPSLPKYALTQRRRYP